MDSEFQPRRLSPVHFRAMVSHPDFPVYPGQKVYTTDSSNPHTGTVSEYGEIIIDGRPYGSLAAAAARLFMKHNKGSRPTDGWTRLCVRNEDGKISTLRSLIEKKWDVLSPDHSVVEDNTKLWEHMVNDLGIGEVTMGADPRLFPPAMPGYNELVF